MIFYSGKCGGKVITKPLFVIWKSESDDDDDDDAHFRFYPLILAANPMNHHVFFLFILANWGRSNTIIIYTLTTVTDGTIYRKPINNIT